MVWVVLATRPVTKMLPVLPEKVFQSGSASVPVLDLPYWILTIPPAFQKYRAALADAKVTVWVKVIVQPAVPDPVAAVLDVVPEKVPTSVPDATALPRLLVMLVRSVFRAAKIVMVSPVTGADRAVIVVFVWLPMAAILLTSPAHWAAVTVPAALTVDKAV